MLEAGDELAGEAVCGDEDVEAAIVEEAVGSN
jgi:hypothetical protein